MEMKRSLDVYSKQLFEKDKKANEKMNQMLIISQEAE